MTGSGSCDKRGLIVAIDGPSGAGKSTVTKQLAERLGYVHLDTGAMYRVVALLTSRAKIDPADAAAVATICGSLDIEFQRRDGTMRVLANGEDVTGDIRSPEISLLTSQVAALPEVRSCLVAMQRRMARTGGVVLEGRDIGTVVFPDAEAKFFLTASAAERGKRRFNELQAKGVPVTLEQTIDEVIRRDRQDSERDHAPLRRADDAVEIDSTSMAPAAVVDLLEQLVREKERQS